MSDFPPVEGVEHRFVEANGIRFHVVEAGSGEPLLLVHGWPQHWYTWRKLIPRLAQGYRVICPDLRGFGWSDAPPGRYEKETLAGDLIALLDALDLDRVKIAGHDWGGFVAYLACLRAPERFERLAVFSMVSPWYRPPLSPLLLIAVLYQYVLATPVVGRRVAAMPGFTRLIISAGCAKSDALSRAELDIYADRLREPDRARASVHLYRTFQLRELLPLARGKYKDKRLPLPVLGAWGDHDPVMTEAGISSAEGHVESLQVEKLHGVGHFLMEEAPERVLELLEPFLAGERAPQPEHAQG